MSPSVHTTHLALLKFVETLPGCPHGCPWQDVHGTPTFSSITPIKEQYQAWAGQTQENGPARLREHLATAHPNDAPQPKVGDRVRVTFEATITMWPPASGRVVNPTGSSRDHILPGNATVEVLPPPTLAERMTMLATELGQPSGPGDYWAGRSEAAERIRTELAAHAATGTATKKDSERRVCGFSHAGPWSLDAFCVLPAGHGGFCDRPKQTEASR